MEQNRRPASLRTKQKELSEPGCRETLAGDR
jgi:hypothetical protein